MLKEKQSHKPTAKATLPTQTEIRRDLMRTQLLQLLRELPQKANSNISEGTLNEYALALEMANSFGAQSELPYKGSAQAKRQLNLVRKRTAHLWDAIKALPMEARQAIDDLRRQEQYESTLSFRQEMAIHLQFCWRTATLAKDHLPPTTKPQKTSSSGRPKGNQAAQVTMVACKIFYLITGKHARPGTNHATGKPDGPGFRFLDEIFTICDLPPNVKGKRPSADHYLRKQCREAKKL